MKFEESAVSAERILRQGVGKRVEGSGKTSEGRSGSQTHQYSEGLTTAPSNEKPLRESVESLHGADALSHRGGSKAEHEDEGKDTSSHLPNSDSAITEGGLVAKPAISGSSRATPRQIKEVDFRCPKH